MPSVVYDHQIFSFQKFGGVSRYFAELATHVQRVDGFSTLVVAPLHINDYVGRSPVKTVGWQMPDGLARGSRVFRKFNSVVAPMLIRSMRPSIVHRTYYDSTYKVKGAKSVLTIFDMIHELFAEHFAPGDPTSAMKRRCVEQADHIVCISHSTKNDLMQLFGVPESRLTVTHLGFSSAFGADFHVADEARTAALSRPYVLYVGQRAGYKNFRKALSAYASSQRLRREFDFLTFGGPRFDPDEQALMRELGLDLGRITRLTGNDRDLARAYANARAFVYPSLYEGFGIPPLEAMSCGCPVVSSNSSSIPEVVGDAAECVDASSVEAIAQALERVCFDEQRRATLVRAGYQRTQSFSWERCALETSQAYRRVLTS